MWYIYAILSSISWGLVTIFGKLASQHVDPSLIVLMQSILVSSILLGSTLLTQHHSLSALSTIQPRDWGYIMLSAATCSLAWLFYFDAFQTGPVTKVVSIDRLSFVFIMLLSTIVFHETLNWLMVTGAFLMVSGIVLVAVA